MSERTIPKVEGAVNCQTNGIAVEQNIKKL